MGMFSLLIPSAIPKPRLTTHHVRREHRVLCPAGKRGGQRLMPVCHSCGQRRPSAVGHCSAPASAAPLGRVWDSQPPGSRSCPRAHSCQLRAGAEARQAAAHWTCSLCPLTRSRRDTGDPKAINPTSQHREEGFLKNILNLMVPG